MDVETGWGWQQGSLCDWSRWLPNAAQKKKITEWTLPICANTDVPTCTHPNKDGLSCISFLSRFLLSLSYVYLSLWKGCASVSLLSLARSLAPRKFIDIHWTQQRVLRPSGTLRSETVCVCSSLSSSVISIVILYQ